MQRHIQELNPQPRVCMLDILALGKYNRVGLVAIYLASVLEAKGSILGYGAELGGQYRDDNTHWSVNLIQNCWHSNPKREYLTYFK